MKIFKIYNKIWVFFLALIIFSCGKDDDLVLNETSHRVVFTSEMDFENKIEVNNAISFGDVSQGVVSRTWTFPAGVADIVESDNDVSSTEANVKAIFTQVGAHNVQLHQVFSVDAYVGTKQKGSELDTTIVVTVLEPVNAAVMANYINEDGSTGDALVISDGALNEVIASKSVRFSYTVSGEPQTFDWEFEGGDPETIDAAEGVDVKYKRVGTYDVTFIPSRARPFGRDTVYLKDLITVVPSTEPVDLEQINDRNGDIALIFSREMNPLTLSADNFTVSIENGGAFIDPVIQKVSVDPSEGNIVLITLDNERLYHDDIVRISYSPGALSTADGVAATAFTDEVLVFNKENLLASTDVDYGIENSDASNWPYKWWGGVWGEYDLSVSSDFAYEGDKSLYIELRLNGGMIIGHSGKFNVETGKTYEMGVWVYLEDIGNPAVDFDPDLRFFWKPATNWAIGPNPGLKSLPVGEWAYSSRFVSFDHEGETEYLIRGWNEFNSSTAKFYIDNLTLYEVELRP